MSGEHRYQPFYCEENAWWLCQHADLAGRARWIVFIANRAGRVGLMHQRAAAPGELITWDYHVIVVAQGQVGFEAWDLDSRLGMPIDCVAYLDATFPPLFGGQVALAPRFRVIEAGEFVSLFSTDRSHMRVGDGYTQPPPAWTPPSNGDAMNLERFIGMESDFAGEVLDLPALRQRYSSQGYSR
jgi:hypothetical protein